MVIKDLFMGGDIEGTITSVNAFGLFGAQAFAAQVA
jgi:hypothetical protein